MGTINKLTKLVLSFLLVITCINFSIVQAEDGSDENYSEPTAVETISEEPASEPEQEVIPEEPVAEEPVIEEAAPVEEEKQEEVTPEVTEEAKVEEKNNIPEIEAEPATQEETVEPEVQQEAPVAPEVQKVETVEEVKVTVVVSYVDESDHPLTDPITGSYPIEYRLDENVDAFKSFDGYAFEKVIVNDDAKNTISKDDVQKNGFRITKDMTSLKLVYQKMNLESNENKEVIPEVTEEAVEETEPESNTNETELSAFDQTAFAGKVGVHASAAEGVLPKGARLIVEQVNRKAILNAVENTVSDNNKEMDSAVALDISIVDKDGVEIQPNGVVNISFENAAVSGDEINVYHVTDDASAVTEVATNTQSFDANHFSIYVITGEKEKPLTTFNFVANGNIVSKQIVKTGDELITPTAPDVAGKAFVGWYDGETKFEDFNTALTITETTTRTITAKYEDALYIYFYNPDGTQIMRTEKVGNHDARNFTDVSYDVDSTHKLVGWAAERNGTKNIAGSIAVPKGSTSVNVYAIIKEGYWISFDSDGGSIVDSQFVLNGDKLTLNKSTNPTKPGYTFDGWYNGSAKVENGATVTNPMTLKAHWNAAEVNYTINYWQQKVTDDKNATDAQKTYEYVEAETKKATTGTPISAENLKTYKGFKYNANNSSKNVEISGDGTTIINVYYDRVLCTVNFYVDKGYYWSDWQISKTVTGLYGANLPKGAWDTSTYSWKSRKSDGSGCVLLTSFDFETAGYAKNQGNVSEKGIVTTCNFYGSQQSGSGKINYYNEQADGSYVLAQSITTGNGTLTVHEKFAGYDLYKYSKGNVNGESAAYWNDLSSKYNVSDGDDIDHERNKPINIASKLKTYSLSYYNYNKVTKTEKSIKYTASLKSYANYTPAKPSELPSYYVFGGWYKDKACTTKFDFNTEKMPNANVQIYAKWTAKKINLTYNLNTPDGTSKKVNGDVAAGTIASDVLPSIPTVDEYSFAGWYVADENDHMTTVAFNANAAILKDTNVIGKWLYNGKLTVKYVADGVKAPEDNNVYAGGAKATVANGVKKEGKKFLGWQLDGGNVYQPGQNFEVNKDLADDKNVITLTAVFGDSETSAILTYHPGNGNGKDQSDAILNNGVVTLKNTSDLSYTAPGEDYYFAGWATSMGDAQKGNATYAAGQSVHVDVDGENVLYAVWVEKAEITLVANSGTRTYDGAEQSIEGFESTTMNGYTVSGLTAVTKGTNVGEYTNTVFDGTAKVEKDGVDVTDKVAVKTRAGKLVITPKSIKTQEITVTKPADSQYDGNEHKNKPTIKDGEKVLVEDTDYTLSYSEDVINAGTVTVTIKGKGNYSQETTVDYQITPRTVKLTSGSDSKTYDGTPLTKHEVKEDGFVKDDGATYDFTGSQTNVGTSDNTFTYNLKDGTLASNYIITTEAGKLTVNPVTDKVTVTIKEHSAEHVYDGTEKTVTGYDVKSISNKHYTKDDFTFTGKAEVKGTNVGEYPMNVQASDFTNNSHNFTNVTFVIEDGSLKITPKSIVPSETNGMEVTGPADTKYNGDEQKLTPVVKDQGKVLTENVDYKLSYTGDTTNVGTVKITIKGKGNYNGSTEVSYKITERSVTLTSATDSKVYDKDPLTNHNVAVGGDGFVKEEGATYNVTGSQTSVGESDNEFTYTLKSNTKAKNYNITTHNGKLIVTAEASEVTVVITGRNGTFPYDGTEKSVKGYDVSITQGSTYTEADFTFSGNDEVKSTEAGTYNMGLKPEDFTNNNTNYSSVTFVVNDGSLVINPKSIIPDGPDTPDEKKTGIEVTDPEGSIYDGLPHVNPLKVTDTKTGKELEENKDYTLTYVGDVVNVGTVKVKVKGIGNYTGEFTKKYQITPREYTVTTDSAEKPYDGTALTAGGRVNNLVDGETVTLKITGSQTEVGSSNNTYSLTWDGSAKEKNYTHGTDSIGTLTVNKQSIDPGTDPEKPNPDYTGAKVNSPKDSVYDGKEHKWSPTVTDKADKKLEAVTDYTVEYSTSDFTNVTGTITVTITGIGNYTGTVVRTYAITPAPLSITTDSANKVYDGNPLTADGRIAGLVNNEKVTFTVTGSQTAVGTSDNKYTLEFDQTAKEGNYSIADKDIHIGKLTVTQQNIDPGTDPEKPNPDYTGAKVNSPKDSVYDGKEHKWSPTVTDKADKKLEAGTDYTVSYDTADFTNVHTITVTIEGIGNYTGTVVRTYAITPAEVTVTANNANKVYGENDPELKATVTGTLNNDTVDYTVTRNPGEDVGKYAIHVTGDEDQGNYHVTYTAGKFEITKSGELILTAELTGESATKVYDGNPLAGGATSNVKEGTTITYSTDGGATWTTEVPSITNVGTLNITARAENPNYEPAETTYSLTVTHATAIVTAENKTKVYGTADPELTATVSGTLGNDTVAYTLAREAGENAGKYKITVTGEENQSNYKVTYTPGTFEITPKTIVPDGPETPEEKKTGITVTAPEGSKYDGEEHKNKPTVTDTKTGKTLTEGTDYTLTYSEDVTNAGKVTVTVTGIGNYTGEFDVTYEITKRDVVLTSATDSKPYDGTALRNENVEVTGDGFAAGEGATFAVTGTITNVGTKANTFGYALNKNTLASNYNISTELGTLTITPKSIIPDGPETPEDKKTGITVENPGDVKYDGKDHAEKPVVKDEKTGVTLEEGKDYEIVYPDDIKNAGEITATVVGKGDYEGSFEIKYNITKRDVTFTSATDSKQYDGNALTNGNVEITGDGFIEGEGAEYKVTGTQTQVGNSANEFEYTLNENTLASNYDITKVVGTLTVTAAPAPETPEKPKPEVKKSVDTSDDNNIVFYGNAFFMAMITLAGIIVLRKKSS